MTTRKFGRTALIAVLALSIIMSITGGTIAWFTDEVTSANNVITAGNLDVDVYYGDAAAQNSIQNVSELFKVSLWEPGVVAWENLTVVNNGNLALKYEMTMNATNENTVNGNGLSTALQVGIVEGGVKSTNREEVLGKVTQWVDFADFRAAGSIEAGAADDVYGIVVYWAPKANDNEWNVNNGKKVSDYAATGNNYLHIDLGVKLIATQLVAEDDSFGPDYDAPALLADTAWYDANPAAQEFTIDTFAELAGLAKLVNGGNPLKGKTIKLGADIDMKGSRWTPIGKGSRSFSALFDGQNHTVSNFKVDVVEYAGLFGDARNGGDIKNLTVKNADIKATDRAGAIIGAGYTNLENCHAVDCTVIVTPTLQADGTYDGGAKAGGVMGQVWEGAGNGLTNCTATNVTVIGYRDIGAVLGMAHNNNTVTNCKAYDSEISYLLLEPGMAYADNTPNENIGEVVGRVQSSATVTGSIFSNVSTNSVYVYGLTLIPDGENSKIIVNDKEGFLNLTKLSANWRALFTDGKGTTYTNYANGLGADYYYSKYWTIVLNADIDLNNNTIDPVKLWVGEKTGAPTFDGNNYTISNAKIVTDATTENEAGLFNASSVAFKNLKLDNIHVTGSNVGGSTAGILSGSCNEGISNITITNSSVTGGKYTGGVVGYGYTDVTNCSLTDVTVKGGYKLGGIIGYICASSGTGDVYQNTLTNCTVNGIGGGVFAGGKSEYIVGKVVGNYNCNGACTENEIVNMTTSAAENIGKIEAGNTVNQSANVVNSGDELQDAVNNGSGDIILGGDIDLSQGIVIP